MSLPQGIAFRATLGFVTDGANDFFANGFTSYPTTSTQGNSVGYTGGTASMNDRDRSNAIDPRLAGIDFNSIGTNQAIFRIDLPATGNYNVRIAAGDKNYNQFVKCELFDTLSSLGVLASTSTTAADRWRDATNTEYSSAAWPGSNTAVSKTFTTTQCNFKVGDGSNICPMSYIYIEAAAGSGSTGTLAYTNANDTIVAAGTTTILGTLAKTNASDTSAASGSTTVLGSLVYTNPNDSVVASGSAGGNVITIFNGVTKAGRAGVTATYIIPNSTTILSGVSLPKGVMSETYWVDGNPV